MDEVKAKRITPEEVVKAYEKSGLKAMQHGYYGYSKTDGVKLDCACGIEVMYATTYPDRLHSGEARMHAERLYGTAYTRGFMDGFDEFEQPWIGDDITGYLTGWSDGRAAWTAADKEGLTV